MRLRHDGRQANFAAGLGLQTDSHRARSNPRRTHDFATLNVSENSTHDPNVQTSDPGSTSHTHTNGSAGETPKGHARHSKTVDRQLAFDLSNPVDETGALQERCRPKKLPLGSLPRCSGSSTAAEGTQSPTTCSGLSINRHNVDGERLWKNLKPVDNILWNRDFLASEVGTRVRTWLAPSSNAFCLPLTLRPL